MPVEIIKGLAGLTTGGVIGAYLATSAMRWGGDGIISLRSQCDACHRLLGWHETVPVISFICLGGKCATCRDPIDRFHLLGELGGAILLSAIFVFRPWPEAALEAAAALLLLWLSLIDFKTFTLPNGLVLTLATLGGVHALLEGVWPLNLFVALGIGLTLSILAYGLYRLKRQAALGIGDIKLIMALSLWTGPSTVYVIALGAFIGLIHLSLVRKSESEVPKIAFGPSLAVSAVILAGLTPALGGVTYG